MPNVLEQIAEDPDVIAALDVVRVDGTSVVVAFEDRANDGRFYTDSMTPNQMIIFARGLQKFAEALRADRVQRQQREGNT